MQSRSTTHLHLKSDAMFTDGVFWLAVESAGHKTRGACLLDWKEPTGGMHIIGGSFKIKTHFNNIDIIVLSFVCLLWTKASAKWINVNANIITIIVFIVLCFVLCLFVRNPKKNKTIKGQYHCKFGYILLIYKCSLFDVDCFFVFLHICHKKFQNIFPHLSDLFTFI